MISRTCLCVVLVLAGCATDTIASSAPDAAMSAPDAAVVPDAWSNPDAWTTTTSVTPPTGVTVGAVAAHEVRSSTDACFIQTPDVVSRVYVAEANVTSTCAVGTPEYRFTAQYVVTSMPVSSPTPWRTSGSACMEAPTVGYGVQFSVDARCVDADGTVSSAVNVSACVMWNGSGC